METIGETYWANKTPAAILRMRRKAHLAAQKLARFQDPVILELGCGTETFSKCFLEELPSLRLVACDISPKAIGIAAAHCSAYPHARFEVADVTANVYRPDTFNAVVGNAVLHHLLPVEKPINESFRILKPDGIIWFSEPNMMNPEIALKRNARFIGKILQNIKDETAFFRWSLAVTLRNAGFHDISVEPYDFLYPLIPRPLLSVMDRVGRLLERMPLVRVISGHLLICARKP